jgi:hypothetical protein
MGLWPAVGAASFVAHLIAVSAKARRRRSMPSDVRTTDELWQSPTFRLRVQLWQGRRCEAGENPLDWEAFRASEADVGEPDPGETPPGEFYRFVPDTPDACFGAGVADAFGDVSPAERTWI